MTPPQESRGQFSLFGLSLLAAVTLFWGLNWPIMKIALTDIPPLYFRSTTLIIAGVALLGIARLCGHRVSVPLSAWRPLLWVSLFNITAWNVFLIYGVSLIPSGRAALLGYTMPVWGSLLSIMFLGERIVPRRLVSLLLGLSGIAVLMGGGADAIHPASAGVACMIAAAWSWAIGIVLLKRFSIPLPTVVLSAWSMALGGLPILVAALMLETSRLILPGPWPLFSAMYNILFTFMLCYWAWNRIVLMLPVTVSSLSSLGVPLVGVISGSLLLNEALGWREAIAALLILSSVACISLRR